MTCQLGWRASAVGMSVILNCRLEFTHNAPMKLDAKELYLHVAVELEKARERLGLTQSQLAEKVGLKRTSISNIENCFQRPPLHVFYSICIALELEPSNVLPTVAQVTTSPRMVSVVIGGKARWVSRDVAKQILDNVESSRKG